jgi:uncharacterized protein (DUF4415 family)
VSEIRTPFLLIRAGDFDARLDTVASLETARWNPKEAVTLRPDPDGVAKFKASGKAKDVTMDGSQC